MGKIAELLGLSPEKLIDSVGNVVDKFVTTKAEKEAARLELTKEINRNMEVLENVDLEILKAQIQDNQNARQRDIEANNSTSASWLSKNIAPLLAITVIFLTFGIFGWLVSGEYQKEQENVIFAVLGSLTTLSAGIINYYFGSSVGSAKNREALLESLKK